MNVIYTQAMASEELTLKKAMKFLGIKSPLTMRKYADKGVIPSRRVETVSGPWRVFKKSDLVAFKAKMIKDPTLGMSYLPLDAKPKKKK